VWDRRDGIFGFNTQHVGIMHVPEETVRAAAAESICGGRTQYVGIASIGLAAQVYPRWNICGQFCPMHL